MTPAEPTTYDDSQETDFQLAVHLGGVLADQTRAWALPLTDAQVAEVKSDEPANDFPDGVETHTRFFDLDDEDESWAKLSDAFASGRSGNLRPWFRCLGVVRGNLARTAIAETYYVCLDHKSEIASFYSHIDRARRPHTVRLHFFDRHISEADQLNLTQFQGNYLGYIVCREGELPLVGRALLRPPSYVEISTEIEEEVNLLAQRLPIRGVPFMQQDARLAVCAHVAMWTLQYTAYRRGLSERRLIGEIVRDNRPLQPRSSQGLSDQQVIDGLSAIGFRAETALVPNWESQSLPPVSVEALRPHLGVNAYDFAARAAVDSGQSVDVGQLVVDWLDPDAEYTANERELVHEIQRALLDYTLRDWVDSGMPVYAGLPEHALVVCGRARGHQATYYVHDDQNGPYLQLLDLCHVSRSELLDQTGQFTQPTTDSRPQPEPVPPIDRLLGGTPHRWNPKITPSKAAADMAVLITATPHRLLLAPTAARRRAAQIIDNLPVGSGRERLVAAGDLEVRATMLMGIDYKRQRHDQAKKVMSLQALNAFSGVQLAEWVTVVEGIDPSGVSLYELVFDASSSNDTPLLRLIRVLDTLLLTSPLTEQVRKTSLENFTCGAVRPPIRVGKIPGRSPDRGEGMQSNENPESAASGDPDALFPGGLPASSSEARRTGAAGDLTDVTESTASGAKGRASRRNKKHRPRVTRSGGMRG